jgi:hypothetical protein
MMKAVSPEPKSNQPISHSDQISDSRAGWPLARLL